VVAKSDVHKMTWSLLATHLSMQFGDTRALDDVSIEFKSGEIHGVVGHNGAGKSTLLQVLSGALAPGVGTLTLDGSNLTFSEPFQAIKAGIACVYQELSLPTNLTVTECLFLGHEIGHFGILSKKEMNARAEVLCNEYGIEVDPGKTICSDLSISQRQLLEIAAASNRRARVLLFDEPTTALEPKQVEILFKLMRKLAREENLVVIFVDHRLDEILSVCDRVTALADGKIRLSEEVSNLSIAKLTEAIVGIPRLKSRIAAADESNDEKNSHLMELKQELLLEIKSLKSSRLDVDDFTLQKGEIVGLYGLNGSGRSRFLKTIYGINQFDSGSIYLKGELFKPTEPKSALEKGIAYLSEERKSDGFIPLMNAHENITLPVLRRYKKFKLFINHKMKIEASQAVIQSVNALGNLSGPIARLSGGNQQKVLFAGSILKNPILLLLDEPTKGIDVGAKKEIYELIKTLAHESGVSVIFSAGEEDEILTLAESAVIFRDGVTSGKKFKSSDLSIQLLRTLAIKGA
jgi:ABC-type sugar transport system ATPase subunit